MARTRKTSKEALEEKIEKAEADVIAAKKCRIRWRKDGKIELF